MFDFFAGVTAAILSVAKVLRLRQPGKVFLVIYFERGTMLEFKLILPAPGAADVVSRRLTVQIGDQEVLTPVLALGQEVPLYTGNQGDTVSGSLVDIDDANNASPPRDFEFVLRDTIAPGQPGELGLEVVREFEPDPPTDTPVDPPTDSVDPVDPPTA